MSGLKFDSGKLPTHLLAHDVVKLAEGGMRPAQPARLVQALRCWWNRAGALGTLHLDTDDYLGVARVLEFGAVKYAPRNWELGMAYSRVFAAAMRHYAAISGTDTETGLEHRHHFLCCVMFLTAYVSRGLHQYDDRPGVGPYFSEHDAHLRARELAKDLKRVTITYDEPLRHTESHVEVEL